MKRKKTKRIIAFSMMVAMTFSFAACTSCKRNENPSNTTENPVVDVKSYEGTHVMTATETDVDFIKNGTTDYRILLPQQEKVTTNLKLAKDELVSLFDKATGIELKCDYEMEDGYQHVASAKYISLGETKMSYSAGVETDRASLGNEGVRIVTVDQSIYLKSGSDLGVIFAVYDFMSIMFNFEYYYHDCYELDTNVKNAKLRNFDVTDIPDIPFRAGSVTKVSGAMPTAEESMARYRMRYSGAKDDVLMKVFTAKVETEEEFNKLTKSSPGATSHNSSELLPRSDYPEHKDWFGDDGTQLCYSAHGNEQELELMVAEAARKLEVSIRFYNPIEYPEKNRIGITVEDGGKFCTCSKCAELRKQYGTDAAVVIRFLNKVNDKVQAWFAQPENEPYRRDDFKIVFFAYNSLSRAPVVYNEDTKKYDPIDETVRMANGVGVYFAMNTTLAYSSPIEAEINDDGRAVMQAWSDMTDGIMYWTYASNFKSFFYFYDVFNFYTPKAYSHIAASDAYSWYNQSQVGNIGESTGWQNLLLYLDCKLKWNSSLNMNELVDSYMNAMYREAAPQMKAMFYSIRTHYNNMIIENFEKPFIGERWYEDFSNAKLWPYGTMKSLAEMCDVAMTKIAHYERTNPELYESLVDHINIEWATPAYAMLELHKDKISASELEVLKKRFKEVAIKAGFEETAEGKGDMEDFLAKL